MSEDQDIGFFPPGFDGIQWDLTKAASNLRKHGVSFEEAATAFLDSRSLDFLDPQHSDDEDRRILIGVSQRGRLLTIAYAERPPKIRIINARRSSKTEQQAYRENRGGT